MNDRRRLFLVAYDICDPQRLRLVARFLESRAIRIQYSVFLMLENRAGLDEAVAGLEHLIDPRHDDVRIYPIAHGRSAVMFGAHLVPPEWFPYHEAFAQLRLPLSLAPDDQSSDR